MFDHRRARRGLGLVPLALLASSLGSAAATWAADGDYLGRGLAAFDAGGSNGDAVGGVAVQPDGKVVLVGTAVTGSGTWRPALSRSLPNGTLDGTFGTSGKKLDPFGFSSNATGVAIQLLADGRILVAGTLVYGGGDEDFFVGRLLAGGAPDTTFGGSGTGYRILGFDFGGDLTDTLSAMAVDPQGRIVVVGSVDVSETDIDIGVVRLTAAGGLDTSLSGDGFAMIPVSAASPDYGLAVAIDRNGRIVIGGATWNAITYRFCTVAGTPCAHAPQDSVRALLLEPDGKIVLAGFGLSAPGQVDFGVARVIRSFFLDFGFSADGVTLYDFNLGSGAHTDHGLALDFDRDGRLVVGGTVEFNGFDTDFGWARFDSSYVFADGFEWGLTGPWSSAP